MNDNNIRGRGSRFNLPNRFEQTYIDKDSLEKDSYVEDDDQKKIPTSFFNDNSRTILAKNASPDLGHTYSINPYRGCEHGCIYCYARPTHEYLGFSAGLDFETKIMIKRDAANLLEETFRKKSWKPEAILLSGNTDCYQPVERKLKITRACLEVFLKFRNPVALITKNALIQRDIDILKQLAEMNLVRVVISITTLDRELQRKMEPRTSSPEMRLKTIRALSSNQIPVGVNVAPVIPGLTDTEISTIIKEASLNGAKFAGRIVLRLPHSVKELFSDWITIQFPDRANKILNRIKELHNGKLYESDWGKRMSGEGQWADTIRKIFETACNKYGINKEHIPMTTDLFRRIAGDQQELF